MTEQETIAALQAELEATKRDLTICQSNLQSRNQSLDEAHENARRAEKYLKVKFEEERSNLILRLRELEYRLSANNDRPPCATFGIYYRGRLMQMFDAECSDGNQAINDFISKGYWNYQPAAQAMMRDLYEQGRLEFRLVGLKADNGQQCTIDLPLPTGKSEILDPADIPADDMPSNEGKP